MKFVEVVSTIIKIVETVVLSNYFVSLLFVVIAVVVLYLLYKKNREGFQSNPCEPGKELGCFKRSIYMNNMCYLCAKGTLTDGSCITTEEDGTITKTPPKITDPQCFRIGIVHP